MRPDVRFRCVRRAWITAVCDPSGGYMTETLSIVLVNDRAEIERLGRLVDQFGGEHGLPPETVFHINLALDELVTNVIVHGFENRDRHEIVVRLTLDDDRVLVEVEDDGVPFNPLEVPPPVLDLNIEDRPIGGLGVHFVRSVMDAVEYCRQEGHNIVRMTKAR
jgi:serine/threonine-protein kinase RsbW